MEKRTNSTHQPVKQEKDNHANIAARTSTAKLPQRKVNTQGAQPKIMATTTNDKSSQEQVRSQPTQKMDSQLGHTTHHQATPTENPAAKK
jgi:hypothetical protein